MNFSTRGWILALLFSVPSWAAAEKIPLEKSSWVVLSYSKIPSNKVVFDERGLTIVVDKSAGPTVHKLKTPQVLTGFSVTGVIKGTKAKEKSDFDEDSILRVGLVGVGQQKLSGIKSFFAAAWVKELFALAPEGLGLDKIYFFNITNRPELLKKSRPHPKSDLLVETIAHVVEQEGAYSLSVTLEKPIEVAALWMSSDGDDSGSAFSTTLSNIEIKSR